MIIKITTRYFYVLLHSQGIKFSLFQSHGHAILRMATSVIYIVIPLMTLSGSLDVLIILMYHQEVEVEVRIIS